MKIGFIGCGNMASAMIGGIVKSGLAGQGGIMASAKSEKTRERIRQDRNLLCGTNREVAAYSDILFLAVKPQYYEEVILEIRDAVRPDVIIVTIAPGKTLKWLAGLFGQQRKIVRTMPTTPAMVGEGMTAVGPNPNITDEDLATVLRILSSFGKAEVIPESLIDVATAVSGSSPAYIFLVIEAMADGAVADGMPRDKAYRFAAQAVLGSALKVLDTGKHPGELKDMVCSPGGTTMEAVRVLEEKGLRSALIEAEKACVKKSRSM